MAETPAASLPTDRPFIELVDVSKTFGGTRAVRGVTMPLATRGQIHALVGQNGAGKSTCLGIASGRLAPTSGTVLVDGVEIPHGSPRSARSAGVHAIYQELTIVPALTPAANVFLGNDMTTLGWLRESEMRSRYEVLCSRLGLLPSRTRRAGDLSVAEQQMLEVARALMSEATALLFDEPTASLAHAERDALFSTMDRLRGEGLALTLVTHNLDDVLEHSDVVTVFRDGAVVERRPTSAWSKKEMVAGMLGSAATTSGALTGHRDRPSNSATVAAPITMAVRSLSSPGLLDDISFDLREGEILGIAGLVGSGRSSILRALAGLDRQSLGTVEVGGEKATHPPRSVREARRRGIALLPEDRKGEGLVLPRSGEENVTLGEWQGLSVLGFMRHQKTRTAAKAAAAPVGFNVARIDEPAAALSGGNQQKLMLARWIHAEHPILLADEPTRGVDVGAKGEILTALEAIVARGRSVILVSSELEEVVGLADRVVVIHGGRLIEICDSAGGEITVAHILETIFAANDELETIGSSS
jgi:ABC-type sugar transport system ATPase subunit